MSSYLTVDRTFCPDGNTVLTTSLAGRKDDVRYQFRGFAVDRSSRGPSGMIREANDGWTDYGSPVDRMG